MAKGRRVGVLVPTTNQTFEPDFYRVAPPGVTIHTGRMWLDSSGGVTAMNNDIERVVPYVASAKVELMIYACTGGSFAGGPGFDKQLTARMEKAADVPAIVTSSAMVEALRELGLRRLSVASPYNKESNQKLRAFLEGNGFEVLNVDGEPSLLNSLDAADIGTRTPR